MEPLRGQAIAPDRRKSLWFSVSIGREKTFNQTTLHLRLDGNEGSLCPLSGAESQTSDRRPSSLPFDKKNGLSPTIRQIFDITSPPRHWAEKMLALPQ